MENIVATYTGMPHYQVYYWTGLSACSSLSVRGGPWWYRFIPKPDLALDIESVYEQVRGRLGLKSNWDATDVEKFVTVYRYQDDQHQVRFAIDAHDGKEIFSPELQQSCDLYFKANKWQNEEYPANVLPIVNGNGFLRERHLEKLKSFRNLSQDNDFLFISRMWGGVEHNVRLFEALASLPCKKRLVAIFVKGAAGEEETDRAIQRLEAVGVECTFDLLPIQELWREIGSTRIIMLRAGKYMCIPWRMIDLLCMGACILTDADFEPEWPEPLLVDKHYVSAGIQRPSDTSAASPEEYEKLKEAVTGLLADHDQIHRLQQASSRYFDDHVAPARVGEYIIDCIETMSPGN